MVLARYFEDRPRGFYVDVGAHHPTRFSNTYLFYLQGWAGVNIDGMPGCMERFQKLRPRDRNVEALVSSRAGVLTYHLFNDSAMNTCDPELARQRDGMAHVRLIDTRAIEARPLGEILEEHLREDTAIDFLSVDVEGFDLDVLKSNNWQRFRPRVVLTEDCNLSSLEQALKSPAAVFLAAMNYVLFAKTVNTLFFRQEEFSGSRIPPGAEPAMASS